MNAQLTQDSRIARLDTPLGKDVLGLARFVGTEGLGVLFEYNIEAFSDQQTVDLNNALGKPCSVTHKAFGNPRVFHGILVEAEWLGTKDYFQSYKLVLRPWLWLLSRTSDCRIFENKTAPDIITQVFKDRGFSDYSLRLTEGPYPQLEYCVQYRETDLTFVSRLMEQHGIYYYFEHSAEKHTLVLADSKSSHNPIPALSKMPFMPYSTSDRNDQERVAEWSSQRRFRSGKVTLNDYDFKQSTADLKADDTASESYTRSKMELYDFPGKYDKRSDGDKYAKICLQAQQAFDQHRYASGDAVNLFPGGQVTLEKHPSSSENKQYLVVRAQHTFITEAYRSASGTAERLYFGHYELLESDRPFRSPIVTQKPMIHGIQTAKVVGKSGEEIDVDEYGRIMVQFPWDRKETQSCRIRVAQVWSGKQWGGQFIPRIGMEVVVDFLEGDPDRPLIVGAVYNDVNKLPYDLPANKTQSGTKSDSSKGHGGYNEFMFEDKKGSEKIRMHAEKDHEVVIKHAETQTIGETFIPFSGPAREVTIKNGDDKLTLENGGTRDVHLKLGDDKLKLDAGSRNADIALMDQTKAGVLIKFECGASKITMTPASIMIESPLISLSGALIKLN